MYCKKKIHCYTTVNNDYISGAWVYRIGSYSDLHIFLFCKSFQDKCIAFVTKKKRKTILNKTQPETVSCMLANLKLQHLTVLVLCIQQCPESAAVKRSESSPSSATLSAQFSHHYALMHLGPDQSSQSVCQGWVTAVQTPSTPGVAPELRVTSRLLLLSQCALQKSSFSVGAGI